jgi:hypothetical protein
MMQVDVENIFNSFSQVVMFIELCEIEGPLPNIVLFFRFFYGVHFSFYFQHG